MSDEQLDHNDCSSLISEKDIFDFMYDFDRKLRSGCDFEKQIKIKHKDESKFDLAEAYLEQDKNKIYVYTEHCGFFWFFKDDLEEMRETIISWHEKTESYDIILDKITMFDK